MSFPAYPAYQDSGVEWLGEVPNHWQVRRLGGVFTERREKVSDTEFSALSVTKQGIVPQLETAAKTDDNDNRKGVRAGDFVINSRSDRKGSSGLSQLDGSVSLINTVITPDALLDPTFVHFLLRSVAFQEEFYRYGKGIVADLWSTNFSEMKNILLAFPERPEQAAIAAFLGRETTKIDALIEEQRRLITLLKEKRQAVISHAVTKGLDPAAITKDSNITWLGEVPAHWEVMTLGRRIDSIEQGWSPQAHERGPDDDESAVLRLSAVKDGRFWSSERKALPDGYPDQYNKLIVKSGDFLLTRANTPDLVGDCAIASDCGDTLFSDLIYRLRFDDRLTPEFALLIIRSASTRAQIRSDARGSSMTMAKIAHGHIKNWWIALPTIDEQQKITTQVELRLREIDRAIMELQRLADLFSERRSTIISAAVTGKIDVRGSATVLPFPVDRARARGLVATEIIERSASQATFGRVKFQKTAFLAEGHVGISELAGCYTREAAGPLDRALIDEMESGASNIAGIVANQQGGTGTAVSYRLGQQRGAHRQELADWLGADRTAKLDKLIADFAPLTTKQAEAVATLYGVWNDALSEGNSPTDDEIIAGFLNDWHPEKREKFRASELPEWLGWMRRHGIVPTGSGPNTTTGRLFI